MKKTLDTPINISSAGQKIFLHSVVFGATSGNMKTKTGASKVNISMPKELHDYLKKMVEEHNAKPENAFCPTDFSKMVQKAIRTMMEEDRRSKTGQAMPDHPRWMMNEPGNATPQDNLIRPFTETSGGGSSTPETARYQKGGRRKSTT
jgi:hypothetical protein